MIGLLRIIPHDLLVRAAILGLTFLLGASVGNYRATQRELDRARTEAALETAAVSEVLIKARQKDVAALEADTEATQRADEAVHATLEAAMEEAGEARELAMAQLAKDRAELKQSKETIEGLMNVNEMLATVDLDRILCGSPATRSVLDAAPQAGGGGNPATRFADASATPGASTGAAPAPETAPLTCGQLLRGYLELGEDDAAMRARERAWRGWYRERFK